MSNASDSLVVSGWLRFVTGRRPLWTLMRVGVLVVFSSIWFTQVWLPVRVYSISMEPTYREGQVRLINTWAYRSHPPQRGDIVSITLVGKKVMLLKRIVGLPGERVGIDRGMVSIDGQPLDEPYVKKQRNPWKRVEVRLRPDEYLVIGDNRSMPISDHTMGEVSMQRIVGKILF